MPQQPLADDRADRDTSPCPRTLLRIRLRLLTLCVLPFVAGLLVAAVGPATLRSAVPTWIAVLLVIVGIPLWYLVATALAAAVRPLTKGRPWLFHAIDGVLGVGLLALLYSMLFTPFHGAFLAALATGVVWAMLARRIHLAYRRYFVTQRR